ncbi:CMRF35-like molecule 5 isoform X3 [Brienomyrus brachyistius]|uniref:CMRF35-like molecule 5 isoform X3 n=1 Tax=Brienomyrus brachyistius TaxID=42636 RepID=UPI0020B28142|nr:CMRF35-like molecule 5 isoform X3 [Brienomyrus brachyistius]
MPLTHETQVCFSLLLINGGLPFALALKINEVRGYVGGQVYIDCPYPSDYIYVAKYWCRRPCKNVKDVLIKSEKSDIVISKGRFSLYNNPSGRSFRVTIKKLTLKDAGIYYCGIEKWWKDKYTEVHVSVSNASPASTVPQTDPATRLLTLLDRSMLATQRHVTQLSTGVLRGPDPTATIVINLQNVTVEKANHSTGHLSMGTLGSGIILLGSTFGLLMFFLLVLLTYLSKRLMSKSQGWSGPWPRV